MRKIFISLFLLISTISCEKYQDYCWRCITRKYEMINNIYTVTQLKDTVLCDRDRVDISMYEINHNYYKGHAYEVYTVGESTECYKKIE